MNFTNYFENQTPISITDNMAMNSTVQQYSFPTESLEFDSNRSTDLVNQVIFPLIDNIEASELPITKEKFTTQFACKEVGCNKTYATISGLNNHMKK